ncbi:AMP-binding protein [Candidatus Woesearchaeota archaeon]|nr:AMP-binding protein [Candidatus Woesearchaeota archaeon]
MITQTLQDLVDSLVHEENFDRPAKSARLSNGTRFVKTFGDLYTEITSYANGFLDLGLDKSDRVVLLADNTIDWLSISLGLNYAGIIDVPRGTDSTQDEISFILSHSEAQVAIAQNESALKKILESKSNNIKRIITMFEKDGFMSTSQILEHSKSVVRAIPTVSQDDVAGIVYTSGTTSNPKGVMLTHGNLIINTRDVVQMEGILGEHKWLTFLPPWHVFQRVAEYCALYTKGEMFHTTPIPTNIAKELKNEHPHIITSVPRIWEGIYNKTIQTLENTIEEMNPVLRAVFKAAYPNIIPKKIVPGSMKNKIKESLGGNLVFAVSGGAKFPEHVGDFFRKAGIDILDGYGMTETSPVISAQLRGKKSRNTIGYPIPSMDVRIADYDTNEVYSDFSKPGEIQVKGPCVMKGYFKNETATLEAFTNDGWLKTGDKGHFNKDRELVYDGRLKHTIVLSNGENIEPETLENSLSESQYITTSMVFGEGKHVYAIIVPNFSKVEEYCTKNNIEFNSENIDNILSRDDVRDVLSQEIKKYANSQATASQKIVDFALFPRNFKEGEEITATQKLKRNSIFESARNYINQMMHKA